MNKEEIKRFLPKGEQIIYPNNENITYTGRINDVNKQEPELIFPCSTIEFRFHGTTLRILLSNQRGYWTNYLGVIIDGQQTKYLLPDAGATVLTLAEGLEDTDHEVMIFKRQDSCHILTFHALFVNETAQLLQPKPRCKRRIEVYGDSISAGEISEALDYLGRKDPEDNHGEYSNSYYSYSWMTARKLNAEIHDIAHGGISLLDRTGWFSGPFYVGMETVFDKVRYFRELGNPIEWDFNLWTPHVVVVAIGQNDDHPANIMKSNYDSEASKHWRRHYQMFIEKLRAIYPKAYIVCLLTIMDHDVSWDNAIDEVTRNMRDPKVSHFLFTKNGCGTHGHVRIPEAEVMSDELAAYIEGLGDDVWED